jgi:hypothetical protein
MKDAAYEAAFLHVGALRDLDQNQHGAIAWLGTEWAASRSLCMTFIAALRHDRISAPWVIDGLINGELFTVYVEKVSAPTLARGEVVRACHTR